jgi:hypothetical protein
MRWVSVAFFFATGLAFGRLSASALVSSGGRQIANMAETGLHHEVLAEVLIDSLRFGRRLDNDQ